MTWRERRNIERPVIEVISIEPVFCGLGHLAEGLIEESS